MVSSRLFLKVYLTLLACLAAVALASGIYWRLTVDRDTANVWKRADRFVAEMLPVSDSPAQLRITLERIGRALDADLALYGRDGELLAAAGNAPPMPGEHHRERHFRYRHGDPQVVRLPGGRVLVADITVPWDGTRRGALGYIALIATVVGLAAYPVVRHLTRRLERLREGVEKFGGGALDARVEVKGRDEVAAVASSFNAAAGRIERLVGAHRTLLANASHELRSPLARLRMAIDLSGIPDDDRQNGEIAANLREIDELVDEILLASRLEHAGTAAKLEPLDLSGLVAEECSRHGIEMSGVAAPMSGDRRLLTRLTRNLLLSAMRHGRPPVEVDVSSDTRGVTLTVRDHGDGLPPGEEARVFEPFYRPAGRSESAGGWGLGLALVRQIAELHGGAARYETPADGGARFVVQLPRKE